MSDIEAESLGLVEDVDHLVDVFFEWAEFAGEEVVEGLREEELLAEEVVVWVVEGVDDLEHHDEDWSAVVFELDLGVDLLLVLPPGEEVPN